MKSLIAAISMLGLVGCVTVQQGVPTQPNCIRIDPNRPGQAPTNPDQAPRANPGCQPTVPALR